MEGGSFDLPSIRVFLSGMYGIKLTQYHLACIIFQLIPK